MTRRSTLEYAQAIRLRCGRDGKSDLGSERPAMFQTYPAISSRNGESVSATWRAADRCLSRRATLPDERIYHRPIVTTISKDWRTKATLHYPAG